MQHFRAILWVLDDHHLRRAGLVGMLSPWAKRTAVAIHPLESFDDFRPAFESDESRVASQACILGIGAAALDDPNVGEVIDSIVEALSGQPLVVVGEHVTGSDLCCAAEHGVRGLIPTRMTAEIAVAAIEFILSGGTYFPHDSLIDQVAPVPTDRNQVLLLLRDENGEASQAGPIDEPMIRLTASRPGALQGPEMPRQLTGRQRDVLSALKAGRSNKEIARLLELSEATVKIYVRQLIKKFGVVNRTQVALLASGHEMR